MTLTEAQVKEIESAFEGIVGLPLVRVQGSPPAASFVFEEARRMLPKAPSRNGHMATWSLTIHGAWRLEPPEGEPWTGRVFRRSPDLLRREREALERFAGDRSFVVESVSIARDGGLRIALSRGHALVASPREGIDFETEMGTGRLDERWRLATPADDARGTLTFGVRALAWSARREGSLYGDPPVA